MNVKLFISTTENINLFKPIEINLEKEYYFLLESKHPIIHAFSWRRIIRYASILHPLNKNALNIPDFIEGEYIEKIYLISRENDNKFIKLTLPHLVFVLIPPKINAIPKYIDDLYLYSWATLYDNYEDAKNHTWG